METLNREQVLQKAADLGIVHDKRAKTAKILKMISELTGEEFNEEVNKAPKKEGFLRCIVHSNDRENDEVSMFGSLNGETFQIKLGEEIELPYKYKTVLDDARVTQHTAVVDSDGQPTGKTTVRQTPRYIVEAV